MGGIWWRGGGAGSSIGGGIGGANAVSGAVVSKMNGGAAEKGRRHIFIAELYKCVYRG